MKKLSVHLSLLCLLILLLVPFVGCKKEEPAEETPVTTEGTVETSTTEPATTETPATTDTGMGSDMTTSEPMGSGQ